MDQLIVFKTALLAKEKGFDLPCLNAFLLKFKTPYQWDELQRELNSGDDFDIPLGNNTSHVVKLHQVWSNRPTQPQIVARPTQTALSKWLRDVHKIYIELIMDGWGDDNNVSDEIGYRAFIWRVGKPKPHPADDLGMSYYERIMEIALVDALKMIGDDEQD